MRANSPLGGAGHQIIGRAGVVGNTEQFPPAAGSATEGMSEANAKKFGNLEALLAAQAGALGDRQIASSAAVNVMALGQKHAHSSTIGIPYSKSQQHNASSHVVTLRDEEGRSMLQNKSAVKKTQQNSAYSNVDLKGHEVEDGNNQVFTGISGSPI